MGPKRMCLPRASLLVTLGTLAGRSQFRRCVEHAVLDPHDDFDVCACIGRSDFGDEGRAVRLGIAREAGRSLLGRLGEAMPKAAVGCVVAHERASGKHG